MVIVLSADNVRNNVRICIIQIDLGMTNIYTSCLYKFHPNRYNKYNFLVLLADIMRNTIRICVIQMDLEKTIIYTRYLYKSKWI